MAHNTLILSQLFVTDQYRDQAEIKYQIKQLESRFNKYLDVHSELDFFPAEVNALSETLANKYLEYLKLIDIKYKHESFEFAVSGKTLNWQKQYRLILHLKEQLSKSVPIDVECKLISEIVAYYHDLKKLVKTPYSPSNVTSKLEGLNKLFNENDLESWLYIVVEFWNEHDVKNLELSSLFHEWNRLQKQSALDFFSKTEWVNLVNAMFFYKLYPDKLFNELIHPEKLVSIRMRLGLLHHFIEQLESQLYSTAVQNGFKPNVDYLFHGDELPDGIMIEVDEEFREMIQLVLKELKVKHTQESEEQVTIDRLHDLGRAYKFWFNPNRLIDAVMVLQQRLIKEDVIEENKLLAFYQEMVVLYRHLTTTECLDLYGYFTNNDSRYLLYTLFSIENGYPLDWLPELNPNEKDAITIVFEALQCVMEALREELKIRHVTTAPYIYDLAKEHIQPGRRNRDAVFRIISIYGGETLTHNDTVEQLFNFIEDGNQDL